MVFDFGEYIILEFEANIKPCLHETILNNKLIHVLKNMSQQNHKARETQKI